MKLPSTFDEVDQLDRLVHEAARLVILTALPSCASADFVFLQRITGLTNGNLSAHLVFRPPDHSPTQVAGGEIERSTRLGSLLSDYRQMP
jgi:hypothetical protein